MCGKAVELDEAVATQADQVVHARCHPILVRTSVLRRAAGPDRKILSCCERRRKYLKMPGARGLPWCSDADSQQGGQQSVAVDLSALREAPPR